MARKIRGLRRHGAGWQTYTSVGGAFQCESWPADTPEAEMVAWLKARRGVRRSHGPGHKSFPKDARTYLEKVTALPTYDERVRHIELWIAVFGHVRRAAITSADIRAQRDRWLLEGLAPHTVNLRLRSLSNVWTVLDGRRAPNPVREVPEAQEADAEPRAMPYWIAERLIDSMPARATLERTQAQMMLTLGLTPVELSRLEAKHWRDDGLFVQGRRKGKGGASRLIPLTEAAQRVLRAFAAVDGWQRMPSKQFYRVLERAKRRVARDPLTIDASTRARILDVRAYDWRHTHATALYDASGDATAAALILGHASPSTTRRYIAAALQSRAEKAVHALVQKHASEVRQQD